MAPNGLFDEKIARLCAIMHDWTWLSGQSAVGNDRRTERKVLLFLPSGVMGGIFLPLLTFINLH
jgi:hypothetical protein